MQLLLQDLGRWQDYPLSNIITTTKQRNLAHTEPRISLFCTLQKVCMDYMEKTVVNLRLTSPNCTKLLKTRGVLLEKNSQLQLALSYY